MTADFLYKYSEGIWNEYTLPALQEHYFSSRILTVNNSCQPIITTRCSIYVFANDEFHTINNEYTCRFQPDLFLKITSDDHIWYPENGLYRSKYPLKAEYLLAESQDLSIFPNPATERLSINSESQWTSGEIFDINGRMVKKIEAGDSENAILVSDLKNGLYAFRFQTPKGVETRTFVKE